jgi:RimJ/RimL family protein N-acetyltransferase
VASRFEGKRVRLTAGKPGDGAVFARWDAEQTESARMLYEIGFPRPQTLAETPSEDKPPDGDHFPFTIETLAGEVVGGIHVQKCDPRNGTFMYGLAIFPPQQQKGYASEAVRLALRYVFEERRYQKCTVEVYAFNPRSIRLHERLGFTLEARLRRMIYTGGEYHDVLVYGMTREEFATQNPL